MYGKVHSHWCWGFFQNSVLVRRLHCVSCARTEEVILFHGCAHDSCSGVHHLTSWTCTSCIHWARSPLARAEDVITDPVMQTFELLLQIQTCLHMKLRAHIRNTVKLSIFFPDSWNHLNYSFTRSQTHDGLRCACNMNAWSPRSDTILNQLIVPPNSWQSCHILLGNPLSVLLTRHRGDCWSMEDWANEGKRLNEKVWRHNLWQVRNRKNVKISVNRWELKIYKGCDILQSL
jgi:hypothetical protein